MQLRRADWPARRQHLFTVRSTPATVGIINRRRVLAFHCSSYQLGLLIILFAQSTSANKLVSLPILDWPIRCLRCMSRNFMSWRFTIIRYCWLRHYGRCISWRLLIDFNGLFIIIPYRRSKPSVYRFLGLSVCRWRVIYYTVYSCCQLGLTRQLQYNNIHCRRVCAWRYDISDITMQSSHRCSCERDQTSQLEFTVLSFSTGYYSYNCDKTTSVSQAYRELHCSPCSATRHHHHHNGQL